MHTKVSAASGLGQLDFPLPRWWQQSDLLNSVNDGDGEHNGNETVEELPDSNQTVGDPNANLGLFGDNGRRHGIGSEIGESDEDELNLTKRQYGLLINQYYALPGTKRLVDGDSNYNEDKDEDRDEGTSDGNPHTTGGDTRPGKGDMYLRKRTRLLWSESDEQRLLAYKERMAMKWDDIFSRFPDRTPGAVRAR
ncbi:hypothetical protein K469DRAFT_682154 [Zopfia rhizophila CBS 207.26]|uniref:Myb-like domain-containing protein n=1 Tax=Zopfia rhizophila CBS 207.26 TaxID=1314779 RepID=A0A6A6F1C0_9PEZI|nr:hypothetical protein K469DRAFT_682154 [Zopfia rhizophila CBS 207.26]